MVAYCGFRFLMCRVLIHRIEACIQCHVWIRAVLVFNKDSLGCTRVHLVMRHDLAMSLYRRVKPASRDFVTTKVPTPHLSRRTYIRVQIVRAHTNLSRSSKESPSSSSFPFQTTSSLSLLPDLRIHRPIQPTHHPNRPYFANASQETSTSLSSHHASRIVYSRLHETGHAN